MGGSIRGRERREVRDRPDRRTPASPDRAVPRRRTARSGALAGWGSAWATLGGSPLAARLERYLTRLLGEAPHPLGGSHLVDGFRDRVMDGLPEHDRGVLVEVRVRPEDEAVEEAGDRHREDRGLKASLAVAHQEAEEEEHERPDDEGGAPGPYKLKEVQSLVALAACYGPIKEKVANEEQEDDEEDIEEDARNSRKPPGEEVPGAEGRGANVEVQALTADPQIDPLPGTRAALLPGDGLDLQVRDLAPVGALPYQLVEVLRRGGKALDQAMPVTLYLRLAHGFGSFPGIVTRSVRRRVRAGPIEA